MLLLSLQDQVNLVAQYSKSEYDVIMQHQRGDSFYIRYVFCLNNSYSQFFLSFLLCRVYDIKIWQKQAMSGFFIHPLSGFLLKSRYSLMSSAAHWFGSVEFWIFVLFFPLHLLVANNNKYSIFKIQQVQIDELPRTKGVKRVLFCFFKQFGYKNLFSTIDDLVRSNYESTNPVFTNIFQFWVGEKENHLLLVQNKFVTDKIFSQFWTVFRIITNIDEKNCWNQDS